jgi:hypothetical protein
VYYYRARYYHPTLQRFVSEDPIGVLGGDVNFYAHVRGNPLTFRDPLGLEFTTGPTYGFTGIAGAGYGVAGTLSASGGMAFGPDSVSLGGAVSGGGFIGGPGANVGVPEQGKHVADVFVAGFGASQLGPGYLISNAKAFTDFKGMGTTTILALGVVGLQIDQSGDTWALNISGALGVGVARFRTVGVYAIDVPIADPRLGARHFAMPQAEPIFGRSVRIGGRK